MRIRFTCLLCFFMIMAYSGKSQFIQNFCPVNPNEYSFESIKDSIEVICDKYVKDALNDKRLPNATYTFRIEFSYCPTSTESEIAALNQIADSLLPIVRKQFKPLKIEESDFIVMGGVTPPRFYKDGKTCLDFIGIRIQLMIADSGN